MRNFPHLTLAGILLCLTSLACALPGFGNSQPTPAEAGPAVAITDLTPGQRLELGRELQILSTAEDPTGIVRTELLVDGQVIWVDANADPQPNVPFIVAQPWTPTAPGSHVIQARAYNKNNVTGESAPLTVEVAAASAQVAGETPQLDTVEPSPTLPTATPVAALQAAPSPTIPARSTSTSMPPVATFTPTLILPTPSATPTPGVFTATGLLPEGRVGEIWEELGGGKSRLGYPTAPVIADRDFAKQYFERGLMFWWDAPDDPDYIWVIDSPAPDLRRGATSNRYVDEWDGDDDYACDEARANAEKGPVRGFGRLWCQRPELQSRLGNPIEMEAGSGGNPPFSQVQFFQGGVMLYNPLNAELYVLFDQGDWQRFNW